jgi:hypothetical protein
MPFEFKYLNDLRGIRVGVSGNQPEVLVQWLRDQGATVSPLPSGALLRLAANSAEHLARFLRESLSFVADLLGGDPFQHRW